MAAKHRLAVLGVGNMGEALVRGIVRAGALPPEQIAAADIDASRVAALAQELGVIPAASNAEAAATSEYVLLAVKPATIDSLAQEIATALTPDHTLVSIAAGVPLRRLKRALGDSRPALVRVMPNTPALVGEGMFAVAAPGVSAERVEMLKSLLGSIGRVVEVGEEMMDAVTGLSGSGPAFVYLMIEALADGGVASGLPRSVAHQLAVQTVAGSAKMVQETGQHPGALKDAVASPGGTTIAGLAELERAGFRGAVLSAVRAAAARARQLSGGD